MSSGHFDETARFRATARFREQLPAGCPPQTAEEIVSEKICYRLVRNALPKDEDFRSQRALQPNRDFNLSECRVRGLSVFTQQADAERAAMRSRNLRGAQVARLALSPGAGYIKQTGMRSHHTWWPYFEFDILAHCALVEVEATE